MSLLKVENLKMYYKTTKGFVRAVDDVSFKIDEGVSLGIAGESGCGKTSVALSILRALPNNGRIIGGRILFDGENLLEIKSKRFREQITWKKLSLVFQGAMNSLHPIFKIGDQIAEAILLHEHVTKKKALERAERLLDLVGIGAERIDRYPHELSGGMKQRVAIAMAIACNPKLIIADEPTTALDVITQAQVLKVLKELQEKLHLSMIEISHDISIISQTCEEIAIMYAGKVIEYGNIVSVFKNPVHPYTEKLINAFPSIIGPKKGIITIPGYPPNLLSPPSGCRFHPRCPYATERCRKEEPMIEKVGKKHFVVCHIIR